MKLMKKLIAILIITTLCLPFTYTVSATNISSENSWDLPENQYNKLHFYFLDSDYSTIDSGEEMVAAFSSEHTPSLIDTQTKRTVPTE